MWVKLASVLVGVITVAPTPAFAADDPPFQSRVYATREGLVGKNTANGHVITSHDHFVALPSRRGLSAKGGGDRSVQVCSDNGRCEYAPVWDVGPWNTHDDYWNPDRQEWGDLPHGTPQAQAAYYDEYNAKKDEFGRTVDNPAGIDLADGTFWDGLRLTNNAWVTVTFLWTGLSPGAGKAETLLNLRSGPGTDHAVVGLAAPYAVLPLECQTRGEQIGSTDRWDKLYGGQYVTHAYVTDQVEPPPC